MKRKNKQQNSKVIKKLKIGNSKLNLKGQSLFEVVIAIGVAALILIATVSLSTSSVRNSNFSKNNALATKLAQEGSEFVRQERDEDWNTYLANYTSSGTIYLNVSFANQSNPLIDGVFNRTITTICSFYNSITRTTISVACGSGSTANMVDSTIRVIWTDSQGVHSVNNVTTLTRWRF